MFSAVCIARFIVPEEVPHLHMNASRQWMKHLTTLQSWHLLLKVGHDSSTDKMMCTRLLTLLKPHAVKRNLPQICSGRLSSLRRQHENIITDFCQPGSCFNKSDDHKQRIWSPSLAGHNYGRRFFSLTPAGIVNAAPASVQPYLRLMRLDKPIGELMSNDTLSRKLKQALLCFIVILM